MWHSQCQAFIFSMVFGQTLIILAKANFLLLLVDFLFIIKKRKQVLCTGAEQELYRLYKVLPKRRVQAMKDIDFYKDDFSQEIPDKMYSRRDFFKTTGAGIFISFTFGGLPAFGQRGGPDYPDYFNASSLITQ